MSNRAHVIAVKFLFPILNVYVHQKHLELNSVASSENCYSLLIFFWSATKSKSASYLAIYSGVEKAWLGATR